MWLLYLDDARTKVGWMFHPLTQRETHFPTKSTNRWLTLGKYPESSSRMSSCEVSILSITVWEFSYSQLSGINKVLTMNLKRRARRKPDCCCCRPSHRTTLFCARSSIIGELHRFDCTRPPPPIHNSRPRVPGGSLLTRVSGCCGWMGMLWVSGPRINCCGAWPAALLLIINLFVLWLQCGFFMQISWKNFFFPKSFSVASFLLLRDYLALWRYSSIHLPLNK